MNRRGFINGILAALGGSLLHPASISAAESPPETTSVTLAKTPALCAAPQFIAEELLRAEGFTEIRFVETIALDLGVPYNTSIERKTYYKDGVILAASPKDMSADCSLAELHPVPKTPS